MAVSYTVSGAGAGIGPFRWCYGTFTSAAGDGNGETLTASTHGLNNLVLAFVSLDTGGLGTSDPKIGISSGTVTWTVDDTLGYAGRFFVLGS